MISPIQRLAIATLTVLALPLLAFGSVPSVKSLSPPSGIAGTTITIRGINFGKAQAGSTVTLNGIPVTPTAWKSTSIIVSVPQGASSGPVLVTVGGLSSNSAQFTMFEPPQITSLSAPSGVVGASLTIAGNNFGDIQGASSVKFNGSAATPTNWSSSSILVNVPPAATSGPVVVTVNGGPSPGIFFQVVSGPKITSLSPALAAIGSTITIAGSNFGKTQSSSVVKFNGVTSTPANWSASSIAVSVPPGAKSGAVTVTVAGIQSAGSTFIVVPAGGPSAYSIVAGDFDRNYRPDLAIVNRCWSSTDCSTGSVGVLLGNGDGTFLPIVNYPTGGLQSLNAAVGDFNGDGIPDLAVVNNCATTSCSNGSVSILLGYGDGTFLPPLTYASGGYQSLAVAIADFNGDGTPDLAIANSCATASCTSGGAVTVLLGRGDGTFSAPTSYASGGQGAFSLAVSDFNRDGLADIAVVNNCASSGCASGGTVSILLGRGDGTFNPAQPHASGGQSAYSVVAADFNLDRIPDLAVVNECAASGCANGGTVSVLLGNGDGTFKPAVVSPSGGIYAYAVAAADFNWDGYSDLAITNEYSSGGNSNDGVVSVLTGNGDGTFQPPVNLGSNGANPFSVVATNFSRWDSPNLAVVNSCASAINCGTGTLTLWIGYGDGTFGPPASYAASSANSQTGSVVIPQHQVSLTWNTNGVGVIGFNVYRGFQPGGPYTKINPLLDSGTTFTDVSVASGQSYFYVATAVNGSGMESSYSNYVQAVIPSP